jgi:hypothetical protein
MGSSNIWAQEEKMSNNKAADEVPKAFRKAFGALDAWRKEINSVTERHSDEVFQALGEAARSAGWPAEVVEASKQQLTQASKVQVEMMDHMVESWRHQLEGAAEKLPTASTIAHAMPTQPTEFASLAVTPAQFWMQTTAMWQKTWTDAMSAWMAGRPK